jgi:hypothetical protein
MSQPTQPAMVMQDLEESIARTINFASDLNGSTISSVAWTVPTGLTLAASSNTTTSATCRLSATAAGSYTVSCKATLVSGEILKTHTLVTVTA